MLSGVNKTSSKLYIVESLTVVELIVGMWISAGSADSEVHWTVTVKPWSASVEPPSLGAISVRVYTVTSSAIL